MIFPNYSILTRQRVVKYAWKKLNDENIRNGYTVLVQRAVADMLSQFSYRNNVLDTSCDMNVFTSKLIEAMASASHDAIPVVSQSRCTKPYWCQQLTQLSRHEKSVWKQWVAEGRPRDHGNSTWLQYKDAKREFRRAQRHAEYQYNITSMEQLAEMEQIYQKYFWYLVNKSNRVNSANTKRLQPTTNHDGTILYDPDEINKSWETYYADLHTPKDLPQYNDGHAQMVNETLDSLPSTYFTDDIPSRTFSIEDVQRKCVKLKLGKAAGYDGIYGEHLRYGGHVLYKALQILFNTITVRRVVPSHFKRAVIIPIPKGKNRDATNKDNYRGISLLPVISKVYEQLLLDWFDSDVTHINPLQGASHKGCSSLHTSMLLREVVCHNLEHGNAVYVTLLDAKKAFDTVWHGGVFYKLYQSGCNNILWQILKDFYTNFKSCVFVAGKQSGWFEVLQGVHQGGPFSMKMYIMFNNDLLDILGSLSGGAGIRGIDISLTSPAFADDISIMTLYKPHMQIMLNAAYRHSCLWRYEFNSQKSHVIVFGRDLCPARQLYLGDNRIDIVQCEMHLGLPLTSKSNLMVTAIHARVNIGRRNFYASLSLGSSRCPMSPVVISKLYWSIVVPQMTYGLELVDLDNKCESLLEMAHFSMAKATQGLPRTAANVTSLPSLRWFSMHSWLAYKRLMLMWSILLLSMNCMYKRVLVERFMQLHEIDDRYDGKKGPAIMMYETCLEFGLLQRVIDSITSGVYVSKVEWKKTIKRVIWERETNTWIANCIMYRSLTLYRKCICFGIIWPWWLFTKRHPSYVKQCRVLLRLVTGTHAISERLRQLGNSRMCQQCNMMVTDSIPHMLFECQGAEDLRITMWGHVINNSPPALLLSISRMNYTDRCVFLLSGFNCSTLICEWDSVYINVCKFIVAMYDNKVSLMAS